MSLLKKVFRRVKSVRLSMGIIIIIITLSYVFIFDVVMDSMYSSIKENMISNNVNLINQMKNNVEYILKDCEANSVNIVLDKNVTDTIVNDDSANYISRIFNQQKFNNYITKYHILNDNIINIAACDQSGYIYSSPISSTFINNVLEYDEIEYAEKQGKFISQINYINAGKGNEDMILLNYVKPIYSLYNNSDYLGMLIISLDYRQISKIIKTNNTKDEKSYIFDENNRIIGDEDVPFDIHELTYEKTHDILLSENDDYIVLKTEFSIGNWYLIRVINKEYFANQIKSTKGSLKNIMMLSMILITLVIILIILFTYNTIKKLHKRVNIIASGNFNSREVQIYGEFSDVDDALNLMEDSIEQLIRENKHKEEEKKRHMINAIMSQVNPHFIYNTLDCVICLARKNNVPEITVLVESFIDLLQKNLRFKSNYISIKDDIENLKNYQIIQKAKYGDIFNIVFDISDDVFNALIPRMILQPIVENAIFHGIAPKGEEGTVEIKIYYLDKEQGEIKIQIIDDGVGISKEKIKNIFSENKNNRIGLSNVDNHLKILYGEHMGIKISSIEGKYTKVEFVVKEGANVEDTDS